MTRVAESRLLGGRDLPAVERLLKITVLRGGPGAERDVSLISGRAVAEALRSLGHEVYEADIRPGMLDALGQPADLVFPVLHGTFGEDGQLQQILERKGLRYCGSGPAASALAMDKVAAKRRFIEAGVPTPRFDVVTDGRVGQVLEAWSVPVVIKPIAEGSSVDCRIIRDAAELPAALKAMIERHKSFLIEEFIEGPELTVGILGDDALPPIQIRPKRAFYDYEAKYSDDATEYIFDIDLPLELLNEIQVLSIKAHRSLGCRDFSRVDWMVDAASNRAYALEVNTIPGCTDHSLLPKAARRAGLSMPAMCQRIVELACRR